MTRGRRKATGEKHRKNRGAMKAKVPRRKKWGEKKEQSTGKKHECKTKANHDGKNVNESRSRGNGGREKGGTLNEIRH